MVSTPSRLPISRTSAPPPRNWNADVRAYYLERRQTGETVNQLLGETLAEICFIRVAGSFGKGQYRYGCRGGLRSGGISPQANLWNIAALFKRNQDWIGLAFAGVVLIQFCPEAAKLHSDNRVELGVEPVPPPENLGTQRVFFDSGAPSGKGFLTVNRRRFAGAVEPRKVFRPRIRSNCR